MQTKGDFFALHLLSAKTVSMNNKVLFLGLTNLCASRFAEIVFNHIASEHLLRFYGISRGVFLKHRPESIDPRTINALVARGIPITPNFRNPFMLSSKDLSESDYIVSVSVPDAAERLSRTLVGTQKELIEWNFLDVERLAPSQLFPALEAEVYLLARRLQHASMPNPVIA